MYPLYLITKTKNTSWLLWMYRTGFLLRFQDRLVMTTSIPLHSLEYHVFTSFWWYPAPYWYCNVPVICHAICHGWQDGIIQDDPLSVKIILEFCKKSSFPYILVIKQAIFRRKFRKFSMNLKSSGSEKFWRKNKFIFQNSIIHENNRKGKRCIPYL